MYILVSLIENVKDSMLQMLKNSRWIRIPLTRASDAVVIKVSDNGHGIEKDKLVKIFQNEYTSKKDACSMGLHNSANYMTEMEGEM